MAGYVKVWTTTHERGWWYKSLKLIERGFWVELLLQCKMNGDTGGIFVRNLPELATKVNGNRHTVGKMLSRFAKDGQLQVSKMENGMLYIFIPKYREYQDLTVKELHDPIRQKRVKNDTVLPPLRPDQTRPDQTSENAREPDVDNSKLETQPKPSGITRFLGESDAVFKYREYLANNWPAVERLISMVHYVELTDRNAPGSQVDQLTRHVIKGTIPTYLQTNSDEALASLGDRDGGAWDKYIRRWLQRDLKHVRAGGARPSIYKEPMTPDQEAAHYRKHQVDGRTRTSSDFTSDNPDTAVEAALARAHVEREGLRQCYTDKCSFEGTEWTAEGERQYLAEHSKEGGS